MFWFKVNLLESYEFDNDYEYHCYCHEAIFIKTLLDETLNKPPIKVNEDFDFAMKFVRGGGQTRLQNEDFTKKFTRGDERPRLIFLSENVDNNNLLPKIKILYRTFRMDLLLYVETIKLSLKDMAALEISKRVKDKDIQKLYEVIPIKLALEVEKFL